MKQNCYNFLELEEQRDVAWAQGFCMQSAWPSTRPQECPQKLGWQGSALNNVNIEYNENKVLFFLHFELKFLSN